MEQPKNDLEKGIDENGNLRQPLLHHGIEYSKIRKHRKRGKKYSDAQGSAATTIFCTAIVALGPLQFGFCVSVLNHYILIWIRERERAFCRFR